MKMKVPVKRSELLKLMKNNFYDRSPKLEHNIKYKKQFMFGWG